MRSVHDNRLTSYEVDCDNRTVTLHTKAREGNGEAEATTIEFRGVEGYEFRHDAFGNTTGDVVEFSITRMLAEYGSAMAGAFRSSGALGSWALSP